MRDLNGAVVVVAGASSGIGRATALAFAREGARLALAARREELLEEVAEECRGHGASAVVLPTDVTDAEAVKRLAERTVEEYGSIDIWIANAGVGAVGRFEDTPVEAHRRVIETNLLGPLYGAHAVIPLFRRQGHGIFIATVSIGAFAPAPYAAAYSASKFGLDGMLDSLRAELVDSPDLHVCGVYPSFTDTPGMMHGANYTGHELSPEGPIYDNPNDVAETMVAVARRPRARAMVGALAPLSRLGYAVAPRLVEKVAGYGMHHHFDRQPPAPPTDGNLFRPVEQGRGVVGGFYTPPPAWVSPVLMAGAAVAAVVAYRSLGRETERKMRRH